MCACACIRVREQVCVSREQVCVSRCEGAGWARSAPRVGLGEAVKEELAGARCQ